ncbi:MAG TPA: hypothetical protein VJN88_13140 [Ktedonobacterales bacterium]|nr:hypothetical protein [Ktedonobacterales bacterium]
MRIEEQDQGESPSANGHRPPAPREPYSGPILRPLTIFLGVLWLLIMGYGLWQGDTTAIVIALVFALFFGMPSLIVFGFGRRGRGARR